MAFICFYKCHDLRNPIPNQAALFFIALPYLKLLLSLDMIRAEVQLVPLFLAWMRRLPPATLRFSEFEV